MFKSTGLLLTFHYENAKSIKKMYVVFYTCAFILFLFFGGWLISLLLGVDSIHDETVYSIFFSVSCGVLGFECYSHLRQCNFYIKCFPVSRYGCNSLECPVCGKVTSGADSLPKYIGFRRAKECYSNAVSHMRKEHPEIAKQMPLYCKKRGG